MRFNILAYDGIEPIDIGATFGVLSMARRVAPDLEFSVVAPGGAAVVMANDLILSAHHGLDDAPRAEVLMVLGGPGWQAACEDARLLDHIRAAHAAGTVVASVCTGGMILAAAVLLEGRPATTKVEAFGAEIPPLTLLAERSGAEVRHARIIDDGDVVTGGGVSLGIDMTLHLVRRFLGPEAFEETARILEYSAAYEANAKRLEDVGV
jgi:transcriptional regulator GlxA family with amidase domain